MWKWKGRQIAQMVLKEPNEPMKSIRSGPTDCSIKGLTVFFFSCAKPIKLLFYRLNRRKWDVGRFVDGRLVRLLDTRWVINSYL